MIILVVEKPHLGLFMYYSIIVTATVSVHSGLFAVLLPVLCFTNIAYKLF